MNQVLGNSAGHSLEVIECIEFLTSNKKASRLEVITKNLASRIFLKVSEKLEIIFKPNFFVSKDVFCSKNMFSIEKIVRM